MNGKTLTPVPGLRDITADKRKARRDRNVGPARYRRAMQREVLTEISLRSLERAVGTAAVARGLSYARERAVREMHWDPAEGVLHGRVRGQGTNVYATTAHLSAEARPEFEWGDCSCPVAFNCKHVAALILTTLFTQPTPPERQAQPVSWEQSLQALLEVPSATVPARSGGTSLAMELSLTAAAHPAARSGPVTAGSPLKLIARLVRPGKNGGWVGGSLSWSRLSSLGYDGNFPPAQVRLLREIYALSRSEAGAGGLLRLLPLRRRQDHRSVGVRLTPALATAGGSRGDRPPAGAPRQARPGGLA